MAISSPAWLGHTRLDRLYRESGAAAWNVPAVDFGAALEASARKAFGDRPPDPAAIDRYLATLHLADLALACACVAGNDRAWEYVIRQYRPALYRAADAVDPSGSARELADAIYGELFGTESQSGARRSLFRYFHGRSSLATWLRAVLAQRVVDRARSGRRTQPLEAAAELPDRRLAPDPEQLRIVALMREALSRAIGEVGDRDRLRLGCYYAQELTLAEIGRLLGEHEATVSRHLARTRREIRAAVDAWLASAHRLDAHAIAHCWRSVGDDAGSLDLAELLGTRGRKTLADARSKE
jgi:RNA polymerase sigma-70 factor (ECF subfamily)